MGSNLELVFYIVLIVVFLGVVGSWLYEVVMLHREQRAKITELEEWKRERERSRGK